MYPDRVREYQGGALREALAGAEFQYALYTVEADDSFGRFPDGGWISGDISELALLAAPFEHSRMARRNSGQLVGERSHQGSRRVYCSPPTRIFHRRNCRHTTGTD